jgi:uncharacterized protein (UPF0335 family)
VESSSKFPQLTVRPIGFSGEAPVCTDKPLLSSHVPDRIASGTIERLTERVVNRIDAAMQPIIDEINAILRDLAGKHFDVDSAREEIAHLRRVVHRAGCEFTLGQRTVVLRAVPQTSRNAGIELISHSENRQTLELSSSKFPHLTIRPNS